MDRKQAEFTRSGLAAGALHGVGAAAACAAAAVVSLAYDDAHKVRTVGDALNGLLLFGVFMVPVGLVLGGLLGPLIGFCSRSRRRRSTAAAAGAGIALAAWTAVIALLLWTQDARWTSSWTELWLGPGLAGALAACRTGAVLWRPTRATRSGG